MKKCLVLGFLLIIMSISGCSSAVNSSKQVMGDSSKETKTEEKTETIQSEKETAVLTPDELKAIQVDESGEVMVLMYHNIGEEATWVRTADNFKKDLSTLYEKGYRAISLEDYATGNISTEKGHTPVVITFDDGKENNFRYIEENGRKRIDPNCAVGIMEDFKASHPDFNMTASFFLNGLAFGNKEEEKEKLEFLNENGYSVGNHTLTHPSLRKLDAAGIQKEIAGLKEKHETTCPDLNINTLALPFGEKPKGDDFVYTYQGEYNGVSYKNIAVLLVGWDPYLSPYDKNFDFANIHRVRASETNVDNVGLYDWLKAYDKGSKIRYISDGNPNTVVVPENKKENINMDNFSEKKLITY